MADHHFFTRIFQHPLQGAVSPNIEFIFEEVIGQLPGLFHQLFEPLYIELFRALTCVVCSNCSANGRKASSNEKGWLWILM